MQSLVLQVTGEISNVQHISEPSTWAWSPPEKVCARGGPWLQSSMFDVVAQGVQFCMLKQTMETKHALQAILSPNAPPKSPPPGGSPKSKNQATTGLGTLPKVQSKRPRRSQTFLVPGTNAQCLSLIQRGSRLQHQGSITKRDLPYHSISDVFVELNCKFQILDFAACIPAKHGLLWLERYLTFHCVH